MSAELIDHLLTAPVGVQPCENAQAWWPRFCTQMAVWKTPIERAIAGGFAADRVAWAFGAGYQAALRALDPSIAENVIACLCVTESRGNSPRAVEATLAARTGGYVLSGQKKWSTLGPEGALLLVVARLAGGDADRPRLKVARVNASAPGVRIVTMPATRFVPELPHAEVHLDCVSVEDTDLMPGDGYDTVVKPFRSIEDIHVNAAILGYLAAEARRLAWPPVWLADLLAALLSFMVLAARDARAADTHIALEGALRRSHALADQADGHFARCGDLDAARRWQRDRALMAVAGSARSARFARACEHLGLAPPAAK